jgi:hypothetical protein
VGWRSGIVVRRSEVGVRMHFLSGHPKLATKWSSLKSLLHAQLKHRRGQSHLMVKCRPLLGHMCVCLLVRWPVWLQTHSVCIPEVWYSPMCHSLAESTYRIGGRAI